MDRCPLHFTSSSNNVGIFLPLPCSSKDPHLLVHGVQLDDLGVNLSKSPACSSLFRKIDVLKPDRDVATELCEAPLEDEVNATRSCIVRDRLLCVDHASTTFPPELVQVHFVFDVAKEICLLGNPALEGIFKFFAPFEDGGDLFL